MNTRVRQYHPLFLSPKTNRTYRSPKKSPQPSWHSFVSQQVTASYEKIKSQRTLQPVQRQTIAPEETNRTQLHRDYSLSAISLPHTPLKQGEKTLSHTKAATIYQSQRQRELVEFYSQRMQLLQEECIYLRSEFIKHCLKHHRREFEGPAC